MARTETPITSDLEDIRYRWRPSATGDIGGLYGLPRVRAGYDKIRALDINEIRQELEVLMGHTHDYTEAAGGGTTTTTCG